MILNLKVFLLTIFFTDAVFCEIKTDNSTVISRREIIEQQARTAYQNACYRMQELSNWMTAVFRIKSVWASATVNEISSRSEGISESDRRTKPGIPSRPKASASECSLSSVQVTAQTYAYLQSQLVMMKWLLGRNVFKSSKERLEGAKENMRLLETFNSTLNGVVSKLKQSTENASTILDTEALKPQNIGKVLSESGNFFQNLGKNLDKLIFPVSPLKQEAGTVDRDEHSAATAENHVSKDEHSAPSVQTPITKEEHTVASVQNYIAKDERSVSSSVTPVNKNKHSLDDIENPFTKKVHSGNKPVHSVEQESTNNAVMFSSIF